MIGDVPDSLGLHFLSSVDHSSSLKPLLPAIKIQKFQFFSQFGDLVYVTLSVAPVPFSERAEGRVTVVMCGIFAVSFTSAAGLSGEYPA